MDVLHRHNRSHAQQPIHCRKAAVIVRSYPSPLSQAPLSFLSATYLQHVQQRGLSGIVEAQEEQLGVLVEQPQGGQHIVD